MAGNDAAGSASGILKSKDPKKLLDEMVYNVSQAKKELQSQN